jgi:hypothetical protein
MGPAAGCLLSFCCVALFSVLFATQQKEPVEMYSIE